jgi:hypothetical protein
MANTPEELDNGGLQYPRTEEYINLIKEMTPVPSPEY